VCSVPTEPSEEPLLNPTRDIAGSLVLRGGLPIVRLQATRGLGVPLADLLAPLTQHPALSQPIDQQGTATVAALAKLDLFALGKAKDKQDELIHRESCMRHNLMVELEGVA
jgi:hypothetical protein